MRLWLTTAEIADEALPELPATRQGVEALVKRNGWRDYPSKCRKRPGAEGGGFEYHIDLLPAWARLAYLRKHVAIEPGPAPALAREAESEREAETLTGAGTVARDARLQIVTMADRFRGGSGLSVIASDRQFAELFNSGSMPVSPWVKDVVGRISPRSIARWRSAIARGRISSLAVDRGASRKGTGVLDRAEGGAVRNTVLALLAKNPLFTAKHVRAVVRDKYGDALSVGEGRRETLPPVRTFQHQLAIWKHEHRHELTLLTDPDGFKNKVRFSASGSTRASRLNELWQIDASPADVMTKDGRQSVYVAIDIFSRRVVILVSKTAKADAVGLLVRKCLIAWGVPERIKSDNGSDFTAHQTVRLLDALGIEHELSAPFSPWQKGIVERVIRTFQHDCARTLPGFVGHSVADRKKIEAKIAFARRLGADDETLFGVDLTATELQEHVDAWAEKIYAHAPHSGLKGATPFEKAATYAGPVRHIADTAALDVLLARVPGKDGIRRVTKQGIRIDGARYLIGNVMPGEDVLCRMDPADLGRLYVFTTDGETFLGHALAPELAGLDPAATIAKVRAEQKAYLDGRVADIRREARKIGPRDVAGAVLREAGARNHALIAFPKPTEAHDTPIVAAARAATRAPEATPLEGRAAEIHAELQREAAGEAPANVTPLRREETMQQRFKRALDLQDRVSRGETIDQSDAIWLGSYQAGPEFRGMSTVYADFGEAALR